MDMAVPLSPFGDITHVIQLAVAPVFLLAGVGTLLSVLTQRLGRSVDRRRVLAHLMAQVDHGLNESTVRAIGDELAIIERRIRLIYIAISLDVTCALFICLLISLAFIDALVVWDFSRFIAALFIFAMIALTGALLVFLREIFLAVNAPRSAIR
jgi:hypothetical protein